MRRDIILRWYDHWLKEIENGMKREPPMNILVRAPTFRDLQVGGWRLPASS